MSSKSKITRRDYLKATGVFAAGILGVNHFDVGPAWAGVQGFGYGPLEADPEGILELPAGFSYTSFSRTGEWMDDKLKVPGLHDGMAAFPGPRGTTILVRNHELSRDQQDISYHGGDHRLKQRFPKGFVYDSGFGRRPALGGTTTLVYDTKYQKLLRHYLSLAGTTRNCAGGPTPWGSWLTCEETVDRVGEPNEQDHGFVFEVPATSRRKIAKPIPYKAMGRFNHEAVAVDSRTGIVYLTEDREDGLLYRFLPKRRGHLVKGGRLQALKIKGESALDTRNWPDTRWLPVRQSMDVEWVNVVNVESPNDDLRHQGVNDHGAAIFARGEGIWYDSGVLYWTCTNGGPNQQGQVFRYRPSSQEGASGEESEPGQLEIFSQPDNSKILQHADNLTVAPWGDVIICEDGGPVNYLVGITPLGKLYRFARNTLNGSEFAGSTFSPDGSTLFVNIQKPGVTLAITGPWYGLEKRG